MPMGIRQDGTLRAEKSMSEKKLGLNSGSPEPSCSVPLALLWVSLSVRGEEHYLARSAEVSGN